MEAGDCPRVIDILNREGLIEGDGEPGTAEPGDLTRDPVSFPVGRDIRLQALARGDEGFLLALGYSTQRGYGRVHPFVGEVRIGLVDVEVEMPELGFAVRIGQVRLTECQMVAQVPGQPRRTRPLHPRLRPRLRPVRAQGDGDEPRRPGAQGRRVR